LEDKFIKWGRALPVVVLVAVISAVLFNYHKRLHSFKSPLEQETKLLPENLTAVTEGFSVFKSEHGQTTLEIKAKMNREFKNNKYLLESVTVKVLGKEGKRYDTITSKRCEYDQAREEITFLDDVVITLGDLGKSQNLNAGSTPPDRLTILKVDKMKYSQKKGTAETEDEVHFARGHIHGKSRGLTYDSKQESLFLRSQVEIFVEPASQGDAEIEVRSDALKYDKKSNQVELRSNVSIKKSFNELRADVVRAFLNETDSSLTRVDAIGEVRSVSRDPRFLLQMDAQQISYFFGKGGRWLNSIVAQGEVFCRSLDQELKRDLSASRVEILLAAQSNLINILRASGNVRAVFSEKKPVGPKTPPALSRSLEPGDRVVNSPEMVVFLKKDGKQISRVQTKGPSTLEELPLEPKDDRKVLSALAFTLFFAKDSKAMERFIADNRVKVHLIPATGPLKKTASDHLEAYFDRQSRQISQIHQRGNFSYQEEDRVITSTEATYSAQEKLVIVQGHAEAKDNLSKTTADLLELHQLQNLVKARGNVRSVFYNRDTQTKTGMFEPNSPVYASSDFLEAQTQSKIARYWQKAKLWQGDQVIRAETISILRSENKLVAEKNVTSLVYLKDKKRSKDKVDSKPATIQAERMLYEDERQRVFYEKNVRMVSSIGVLTSDQLEIFLVTEGGQRSVQRMVAKGKVKISQPNRRSFSDLAEYFRKEEKVVLTGGTPTIVDSERGSATGARLTIYMDDDRISVEGDSETRSITRQSATR
jgi:LPS export ABC transporter protein LptC